MKSFRIKNNYNNNSKKKKSMKRKFMWASLLLCAGLWACTDDAIDGQSGGQGVGGEGTPAYLTISFSANSGSSTRGTGEGTNTGDKDGNQEDSGHHSTGDAGEEVVKTALVVVAPVDGNVGFAKLYSASADSNGDLTGPNESTDGTTEDNGFTIVDENSKTYTSADPIKVAVGDYRVLVVVNPAKTILEEYGTGTSISSGAQVKALYDFIVTGQYETADGVEGTQEENKTYCNDLADRAGDGQGFMMANKALPGTNGIVTLTEENNADNPAQATIDVERVVSKITYRTSKTDNVYEVQVPGRITAATVEGYVLEKEIEENGTEGLYQKVTLNTALDKAGHVVYAYFKDENGTPSFVAAFYRTEGTHTPQEGTQSEDNKPLNIYKKITPVTEEKQVVMGETYLVDDAQDPGASLTLQAGGATEYETWKVTLVGYALTNLSKDVYYVRHTTETGVPSPFGSLANGTSYLVSSYWDDKNNVQFTDDNQFPAGVNTGTWFYNTLADVSKESETLTYDANTKTFKYINEQSTETASKFFKPLPTGDGDEVTDADGASSTQHTGTLAKTGGFMTYCFENSVLNDKQVHGLTTGVVFVGKISGPDDNPITTPLYAYNGHVFKSLDDIKASYPNVDISGLTDQSTAEELAEKDIVKYTDNMCYYYTSRIKHFDNGNDTDMGVMEYAIMRNNIYSLAVTGISDIGSPIVDPTPDIPNESKEAALDLKVNILPWIVRYNDIEF